MAGSRYRRSPNGVGFEVQLSPKDDWVLVNSYQGPARGGSSVERFEDNDMVLIGCHMRKERVDGGD